MINFNISNIYICNNIILISVLRFHDKLVNM